MHIVHTCTSTFSYHLYTKKTVIRNDRKIVDKGIIASFEITYLLLRAQSLALWKRKESSEDYTFQTSWEQDWRTLQKCALLPSGHLNLEERWKMELNWNTYFHSVRLVYWKWLYMSLTSDHASHTRSIHPLMAFLCFVQTNGMNDAQQWSLLKWFKHSYTTTLMSMYPSC